MGKVNSFSKFIYQSIFIAVIVSLSLSGCSPYKSSKTKSASTSENPTEDSTDPTATPSPSSTPNPTTTPQPATESVVKTNVPLIEKLEVTDGSKYSFGYTFGACVTLGENEIVRATAQAVFLNKTNEYVSLGWNIVRYGPDQIVTNITPPTQQHLSPFAPDLAIQTQGIDNSAPAGKNCYYLLTWATSDKAAGSFLELQPKSGELTIEVK